MDQEALIYQRRRLLSPFSHGLLAGITLGNWLRLLVDNRLRISLENWPRVASITTLSIINSIIHQFEELNYGDIFRRVEVQPPIIILGSARSGTTFLHNLLSIDARLGFPNVFQVRNPNTFLLSEVFATRWTSWMVMGKRGLDEVQTSWQAPGEDEFATCLLTLHSTLLSSVFPQRKGHYNRYSTFEGVPESQVTTWSKALKDFLKKVTWKNNSPLILKSPNHFGRVRFLVDMFPQARYIVITRNPYAIFQSGLKAFLQVARVWNLQHDPNPNKVEEVLQYYRRVFQAFIDQKSMIPDNRLFALRYEDLETDPVSQVRGLYEALDMPDFETVMPAFERYVCSLSGYRKNIYSELPEVVKRQVRQEWKCYFEEWNYPA